VCSRRREAGVDALAVEMTATIKHFIFLLGFIQMYIGVMKIKNENGKIK
jgi:hypothetical protein